MHTIGINISYMEIHKQIGLLRTPEILYFPWKTF